MKKSGTKKKKQADKQEVDEEKYFDNGGPIDRALTGMYVRLEVQRRYF